MSFLSATLAILATLPHALTPGLGSPKWRDRDRTARAVAAFGLLAVPALEAARERHRCPEVRERCGRLLYPFACHLADRDCLTFGPLPPLPVDWIGCGLEWWQHGRGAGATRLWVRSMLLQRRPREEIRRGLDFMRAWQGRAKE